jgi:hypothetical protein
LQANLSIEYQYGISEKKKKKKKKFVQPIKYQ